jgi:hypothetical protein
MNILLSLHARNHLLNIAKILQKNNMLSGVFSPYNSYLLTKYGYDIEEININVNYITTFLSGVNRYLPSPFISNLSAEMLDDWVASLLSEQMPNAIHCMNGSAEKSFMKAKKLNIITILERSCPHIDYQLELLNSESEAQGFNLSNLNSSNN